LDTFTEAHSNFNLLTRSPDFFHPGAAQMPLIVQRPLPDPLLQQIEFDVIISDDEMPGMSGTDLLAEVHRRFPEVIRIMYTGAATVERAARAINEGRIFQFLLKPCRPAEIIGVIHAALQEKRARETTKRALHAAKNQRRVLRELTREVEEVAPIGEGVASSGTLDPEKVGRLTPREREFLQALASGKHVKDSASELNISVHTARNHMKALLRKLGVRSQIELLAKLSGREP